MGILGSGVFSLVVDLSADGEIVGSMRSSPSGLGGIRCKRRRRLYEPSVCGNAHRDLEGVPHDHSLREMLAACLKKHTNRDKVQMTNTRSGSHRDNSFHLIEPQENRALYGV